MKIFLLTSSLVFVVSIGFAQGTINFVNTPTTLVSAGGAGGQTVISDPPGSYYFGLLIAVPGATDPNQFMFTGLHATNHGAICPGQFNGGSNVAVQGWAPFTTMSFLVAGWSLSLGHDWNQQWPSGNFSAPGYFGLSTIGTGLAGGITTPPMRLAPLLVLARFNAQV
jgi:hypothetical protein